MAYTCLNGTAHQHDTAEQGRICWLGNGTPQSRHISHNQPRPASPLQIKYIRDLGGDALHAAKLSTREASAMISDLKSRSGSLQITQPSKLEQVFPLLSVVPDGYFAVQLDTDTKMQFVRISTVTRKDAVLKGHRRIQTIHGPSLDIAASVSPEGKVREYKDVTDAVLLIIADYQGAALRYAKEIGKCCRCNTRLTSDWRKVGVGPECVKYFGWAVERSSEQS